MRLLKGALIVVVLIRWSDYICRFLTLQLLYRFFLIYGGLVRTHSIIQWVFVFGYYLAKFVASFDYSNFVYFPSWDTHLTSSIVRILWMSEGSTAKSLKPMRTHDFVKLTPIKLINAISIERKDCWKIVLTRCRWYQSS
jgi:hypothetical protein